MPNRSSISAELEREERRAWEEYRETTHGVRGTSYEELETWAWGRLLAVRRRIRRERRRLAV